MFKLTFGKTKYLVRVLYKSGNSHSFWTYDFAKEGDVWGWNAVHSTNRPILLGPDHIEAVYVVDERRSVWSLFAHD